MEVIEVSGYVAEEKLAIAKVIDYEKRIRVVSMDSLEIISLLSIALVLPSISMNLSGLISMTRLLIVFCKEFSR